MSLKHLRMENIAGAEREAPRHLAMVLPDLRGGGAERVALRLAQEFARRGHRVDFVLKNATGALLEEAAKNARIIDLGAAKLRNVVAPLMRYLREERPDAVQVSMWPLTIFAIIAHRAARSKARLVLSDHNTLSISYAPKGRLHMRVLGASMALFYPRADALVAVSHGVARDLARLSGMNEDRWSVVYNPVGAPATADAVPAIQPWPQGKAKRILAVGSLTRQKNFVLLVQAFARVARSRDVQLVILGRGPLQGDIEATAKELGVADRVRLPGFVDEPWPFFATADLYVMSSNHEGLPMVLIEALHYGLTIVSTDCPSGPAEILESGRLGTLVPCGDAEALADAMAAALDNPRDPALMRKRAGDFSSAMSADAYLELLLGAPAARRGIGR